MARSPEPDRGLLQGLIQVTAAFHHLQRNILWEPDGCCTLPCVAWSRSGRLWRHIRYGTLWRHSGTDTGNEFEQTDSRTFSTPNTTAI